MDRLSHAQTELNEMGMLSDKNSFIHELHPLSKLLVTILYIVIVVSFSKYDCNKIMIMLLYLVILFQIADIPIRLCFYRLRMILPLLCAVGLANPFFDHIPLLQFGNITITGGIISMITLMLKGIFSLMASFLLIATTPIDAICASLRKLHMPETFTTLLLLTYRYIGVMMQELSVMFQAYRLRAPGQKGIHFSAWGSFLGQLLLRSMDKAKEIYNSMILRGFCDEFYYMDIPSWKFSSTFYLISCALLFFCARFIDISALLGSLLLR